MQQALRWPNNQVTVCFFDGTSASRDHVARIAAEWTTGTGLTFDFGAPGNRRTCDPTRPSDIRVSFAGAGYWSYVGTQAQLISPYKQTMNLAGLDKGSALSEAENGIIRHEFGHAIGFEHEHQSPESGCEEEFNWNYLYVALGWSKEEVDRNLRRLDNSSGKTGLLTTPFDRQSNMLYSLNPEAFKNPTTAKCYIPNPNNNISLTDRTAAQATYPSVAAAARAPVAPAAGPPPAGQPAAAPLAAPPAGASRSAEPDRAPTVQQIRRLQNLLKPPAAR